MEIAVLKNSGEDTGRKINLSDDIFGIEPNDHAIYLDVKQFLANQRQGTHKAKERGEIKGSTRKIKRQKGTGTARAGSIKNPLFRSGGRVFGPRPRDYSFKLNKKVKRLAKRSALSTMATKGRIMVLEDFTFDQPKTKEFAQVIKNLELTNAKSVFVISDYDTNLHMSSRNIKGSRIVHARDLNTYQILEAGKLVISENSLDVIKDTCN
jgi:large subunit ribosomal protein L4